jgi:hypothetical protein
MQYWIFYDGGVGGDGFGCMLEHATNIYPADGILEWRIHDYEDGSTDKPNRFFQAHWTNDPIPFRYTTFQDSVVLNPVYKNLIVQQKNTVITAHYAYFNFINKFKYRNIVEKDQIKIHLYSDRPERVYADVAAKRGINITLEQFVYRYQQLVSYELKRSEYNIHINIEQAWRDWNYMQDCMQQLNIELPKDVYDHYLTYINSLQGENYETSN